MNLSLSNALAAPSVNAPGRFGGYQGRGTQPSTPLQSLYKALHSGVEAIRGSQNVDFGVVTVLSPF